MKDVKGVVIGVVIEVDPARPAVKVRYPWMGDVDSHWAPIATLMSGPGRGVFYMPEVDDEVLVAFGHGQFDQPFIVGCLWNGVDTPPTTEQRMRLIHSVNGHEIAIYDGPPTGGDQGFIRIRDAHGNQIELSNAQINITAVGTLQLRAPSVSINGRPVAPVGPPI